MPVLVISIVISLAFYLYFKIKFFRTTSPIAKKWMTAKSTIALGTFVGLFGLNQLFLYQTITTYIIAGIFITLGAFNIIGGIKAYQAYLPLVIKEAEETAK